MSGFGQSGMPNDIEQQIAFEMMFGVMTQCFKGCVNDFKTGEITSYEKDCLGNCANRLGQTQQIMADAQQEIATKMGGQF